MVTKELSRILLSAAICGTFLGVFLGLTTNGFAATSTGTARVEILKVLLVSEVEQLGFGRLMSSGAEDVITLSPDGTVSSASGKTSFEGTPKPAKFSALGSKDSAISISVSATELKGNGAPISLNNMTHNGGATPTFNTNGLIEFAVGGMLHLNENQAPGEYSGQYTVSVNYP